VKLKNDSILIGYLRYYVSIKDGHQGIEFWRTKKDKHPQKIPKRTIDEYAIKKDTFKVLHQFKPFHDAQTYFEIVDAELTISGRVNLYLIKKYQDSYSVNFYNSGGVGPPILHVNPGNYTYIYILEDKESGFLKALPSNRVELKETLRNFFPEKYIAKYEEVKSKIDYKSIPNLVKLYNSK
jgi:hypothetical protein